MKRILFLLLMLAATGSVRGATYFNDYTTNANNVAHLLAGSNLVVSSGTGSTITYSNISITNINVTITSTGDYSIQLDNIPGDGSYFKFTSGKFHGGSPATVSGSEGQTTFGGNFAMAVGFQSGVIRHWQMGIGNVNQADPLHTIGTYNEWMYWQGAAPFGTTPGYSGAETFKVVLNGQIYYPGLISMSDVNGLYYEMCLYNDLVAVASPTADSWDVTAIKHALKTYIYPASSPEKRGVRLMGGLIQERKTASSGSSYAFDFGAATLTDISVTASAVTFSTLVAGTTSANTNWEDRTFLIRSGGFSPTFTWPPYIVMGVSAGPNALPASLGAGQIMELHLKSVGIGDTNVLATATLGTDSTFSYDTDALAFLGRVSVVPAATTNAINKFISDMKSTTTVADGNAWGKFTNGFIYPFVGGDAASHSKNMVSTSYTITWNNTPTQNSRGVTGNGSSMYGATGFTPSTAAGGNPPSLNSFSTWVYAATNASPANPSFVIGAVGGTSRMGLGYAVVGPAQWTDFAINDNASQEVARVITADGRDAGVVLQRTASNAKTIITTTSGASTVGTASIALPNAEVYVLARNNGGPANYYSGTVKFLACGKSMTTAEAQTVLGLIETLETSLGRNGLTN